MVRAIVGTLLDVGRKKLSITDFEAIVLAKNRSLAGTSVAPEGLFLQDIIYPEDIYL
jgi:tRNA pseudouridine38-40 synthase